MDMMPGGDDVTVFDRAIAFASMAICSLNDAYTIVRPHNITRKRMIKKTHRFIGKNRLPLVVVICVRLIID